MCQDTGTAIVMAKKGRRVWTDGDDEAAHRRGHPRAPIEKKNLRYSQLAPLSMFEEKNTGDNLPAQIDIAAEGEDAYKFLFIAKGGGSANKTFLYQATPSILTHDRMIAFLKEKILTLGTAACPPYHLAIVIGGTERRAEPEDGEARLGPLSRHAADVGRARTARAFRDLALEAEIQKLTQELGVGAQFGGKYFCHDVRVIRLPRHGASLPIGLGVSCSADRQALGKITRDGVFLEELEHDPARFLPAVDEATLGGPVVEIDLNRPMKEILAELTKHPISTRLALTGPMIVARDLAHAKIRERLERGEPMPDYLRNHPVYYAGPAKTPAGHGLGLVRPDHGGADGFLRRPVPGGRRLDGDARQGQPLGGRCARPAPSTAASISARSAARPRGSRRTASGRSRCWNIPSSAWRRSGGSRSRISPPSSSSTTRATTSSRS